MESGSIREPTSAASSAHLKLTNMSEELGSGQVISLLNFESESGEEDKNVTPTTGHSDYHLTRLEDLNKLLSSSIETVLKSMRTKGELFDNEKVLGVEQCQGLGDCFEGKVVLVAVSSHHLLWFEAASRSLLHVTALADAKVLLLPVTKDSIGLVIPNCPIWVKCAKTADLVRAIQYCYQPLKGHFLPYTVFEHPVELQKALSALPPQTMNSLYSYENLQLLSAIVGHGSVGEKIVFVKESIVYAVGVRADCIVALTDEAVYTLNRDFTLDSRIELTDVTAVLVARREEAVGLATQAARTYWKVPLTLSETLEKLIRSRTGRNLKSTFSKSLELTL